MNEWLVEYKAAAHRTWWIGLIGALAMLAVVFRELVRIYIAVSVAEAPFRGDFADTVMAQVGTLSIVAVSFIVRALFLLVLKPERYSWIALSWLMSFVAVVFYLWEILPSYRPATICNADGQCSTIYHQTSADWVALAGFGFILFSLFRALVTAAMAGSRYRYR